MTFQALFMSPVSSKFPKAANLPEIYAATVL